MKDYVYRMRKRVAAKFVRSLGKLECNDVQVNGHETVEIKLTDEALEVINTKAVEVYEGCKRKWSSVDRLNTGIQGQAACADYLLGRWMKGVEQMTVGTPDVFDLWYEGFGHDVKTHDVSGYMRDPDTWMAVNLLKFRTQHHPYYIGCQKLGESVIRILGFISCERLNRVGVLANYSQPHEPDSDLIGLKSIDDLTPINELKETLDREKLRLR